MPSPLVRFHANVLSVGPNPALRSPGLDPVVFGCVALDQGNAETYVHISGPDMRLAPRTRIEYEQSRDKAANKDGVPGGEADVAEQMCRLAQDGIGDTWVVLADVHSVTSQRMPP